MSGRNDISLPAKYRPSSLKEIVGQPEAVARLRGFADLCKVTGGGAAAFVFHGPPGVGKTVAAWSLAFELGCDRIDPWMGGVTEIPSGQQDGAAVDQLLRSLCLRPMKGSGWRVAIINEADQMTRQAEAMWLDGLERLPSRTVVIFTTNEVSSMSARFVWRCESIEFTGDPRRLRKPFNRFVKKVYRAETGEDLESIPQGLGVFDIAGGTLSFRLALQQLAPHCQTGRPLPANIQPPIVRDNDAFRNDTGKEAARKAWATRRAQKEVTRA